MCVCVWHAYCLSCLCSLCGISLTNRIIRMGTMKTLRFEDTVGILFYFWRKKGRALLMRKTTTSLNIDQPMYGALTMSIERLESGRSRSHPHNYISLSSCWFSLLTVFQLHDYSVNDDGCIMNQELNRVNTLNAAMVPPRLWVKREVFWRHEPL